MHLNTLIVLLLSLTIVSGATTFVYQAGVSFDASVNVTLPAPNPVFNYRKHTSEVFAGVFTDLSVQITASGDSANANGILSAAYSDALNAPALYMAFYNSSASLDFGLNPISTDVSGSAAFVGLVLASIQEISSSNTIVATYNFSSLSWIAPTVLNTADSVRGLVSASFTTSISGGTIAITVAASAVLGVLNNGGAIITPSALETFFEVNGYTYASSSNHLRLTFYFIQVSGSAGVVSEQTVTAGSGAAQVWMTASSTAQVSGSSQGVTVSGMSDGTIDVSQIPNSLIISQINSYSHLHTEVRKITVDFTANATAITYDPTVGYGNPNYSPASPSPSPSTSSSDATQKVTVFWSLICLAVMAAFLIVAV
jgi:hypothetical protein